MFKFTQDEIEDAKKSGFYELVDKQTYTFCISDVEEKDDGAVVIKTVIINSGEGNGRNYNIYYGKNPVGTAQLIRLFNLSSNKSSYS